MGAAGVFQLSEEVSFEKSVTETIQKRIVHDKNHSVGEDNLTRIWNGSTVTLGYNDTFSPGAANNSLENTTISFSKIGSINPGSQNGSFAYEDWNETGANDYPVTVRDYWFTNVDKTDDGQIKQVELTVSVDTTQLGEWLTNKTCKDDDKGCERHNAFNDGWFYSGGDINESWANDLSSDIDNMPFYRDGTLEKTANIGDKPKNVTLKFKDWNGTASHQATIGNRSVSLSVSSGAAWGDNGNFSSQMNTSWNGHLMMDNVGHFDNFEGDSGNGGIDSAWSGDTGRFQANTTLHDNGVQERKFAGWLDSSGNGPTVTYSHSSAQKPRNITFWVMYKHSNGLTPEIEWEHSNGSEMFEIVIQEDGEVNLRDNMNNNNIVLCSSCANDREWIRIELRNISYTDKTLHAFAYNKEGVLQGQEHDVSWSPTGVGDHFDQLTLVNNDGGGGDGAGWFMVDEAYSHGSWESNITDVLGTHSLDWIQYNMSKNATNTTTWLTFRSLDNDGSILGEVTTRIEDEGLFNISQSKVDAVENFEKYQILFNISGDGRSDRIATFKTATSSTIIFKNSSMDWLKVGKSSLKRVDYGFSYSGNVSSVTAAPSGTQSSDNHTSTVSGISSPFDWFAQVQTMSGVFGAEREINVTLSQPFNYTQNVTGTVNETFQTLNSSATVNVRGDPLNVTITDSQPATLLQTVVENEVNTSTAVTGVQSAYWYYRVDHIESTVFAERQSNLSDSNLSTQLLYREKQVRNNWSVNYTGLEVEGPAIMGTCTNCGLRNLTVNGNTAINETYNSTADVLNARNFSFNVQPSEVTTGVNYLGHRNLEVEETGGVRFVELNLSTGVVPPEGCSQNNYTLATVSASQSTNFTVEFSCTPGDVTNPFIQKVGSNTYWYNATNFTVRTNLTENTRFVWKINEDDLTSWTERDPGTIAGYMDNSSTNVTVVDGSGFVYLKVGTSHTQSSVHEGNHYAALTYTTSSDSNNNGGGGGGGGSTTDDDDDDGGNASFSIVFQPNNPYHFAPGADSRSEVKIKNFNPRKNTVNVIEQTKSFQACRYISIATSFSSDSSFGDRGTYRMPGSGESFSSAATRFIDFKVDLPPEPTLNRVVTDGKLRCGYVAKAQYGRSEDLVVVIEPRKGLVQFINDQLKKLIDPNVRYTTGKAVCLPSGNTTRTGECRAAVVSFPQPTNTAVGIGVLFLVLGGGAMFVFRHVLLKPLTKM